MREQDLINYYTVVPEMTHKNSELQVLITVGSFKWNGTAEQTMGENGEAVVDGRRAEGMVPLLEDFPHDSLDDEDTGPVLPTLRSINIQVSKVCMYLYIYVCKDMPYGSTILYYVLDMCRYSS